MSPAGRVLSMRWGGDQAAVGVAGQPPAALMDRPMMGPTHQGQVGQVGRAAMQPVPQMMGLTPAQRPITAGDAQPPSRTARAARWAAVTTRVVRPTSRGWVGAPPRIGGSLAAAVRSRAATPPSPRCGRRRRSGRRGRHGRLAAVAGGVAGDQDPGDRPVAGQPPTRLRRQRPHPPSITPQPSRAAQEAVQVHRHQQLRPHPTRLGEPPAFQVAAGQLTQSISPPLATGASVVGGGWAGQRLQGRQHDLASLRFQQPIQGHHPLPGRRHPQPPALMTPFGLGVGTLRVGDPAQLADDPPQPQRVQPPGRLDQHRFGLGGGVGGQILGAGRQHLSVGR